MNSSKSTNPKIYTVTGASGKVGSVVVRELRALGHQVRPVCRQAGIAFEDESALTDAFQGADGVFLTLPAEVTADDLRRRQNELGQMLFAALQRSKVRRVVLLSSFNWEYASGTGPVLGLRDLEGRLELSGVPERIYLRPGFFMENHLRGIPGIKQFGVYGSAFAPDEPVPMIAARDVGHAATQALVEQPFSGNCIRELLGPRDYTMAEAAPILGAAIGLPDLRYVQFPYDQVKDGMLRSGISPGYADAIMEIVRSFNERRTNGRTGRTEKNSMPTHLEEFARETFRKAFENAKAA